MFTTTPSRVQNCFEKEIFDDWYSKKRRIRRYFTPYLSAVSFALYLSSVTLFHGVSIVRHAAARTTNLHHH
jgi:hypothetical protein